MRSTASPSAAVISRTITSPDTRRGYLPHKSWTFRRSVLPWSLGTQLGGDRGGHAEGRAGAPGGPNGAPAGEGVEGLGRVQRRDAGPAAGEDRPALVRAGAGRRGRVVRQPAQPRGARSDREPQAGVRAGLRDPRRSRL